MQPTNITAADHAWLAGFIDGEGCLALYNTRRVATLQIVGTCDVTCDHVVSVLRALGAHPYAHPRPAVDPLRHRPSWVVQLRRTADLLIVARVLRPYSITKAKQWALIEEWCSTRRGRGVQRPPERLRRDAEIEADLRDLNRRGPRRPPATALDDAPEWARSESEQEWRAEMLADAR